MFPIFRLVRDNKPTKERTRELQIGLTYFLKANSPVRTYLLSMLMILCTCSHWNMDYVRSYFDKNEPLTGWTLLSSLLSSLFFQFICTNVTSYKIHILAYNLGPIYLTHFWLQIVVLIPDQGNELGSLQYPCFLFGFQAQRFWQNFLTSTNIQTHHTAW